MQESHARASWKQLQGTNVGVCPPGNRRRVVFFLCLLIVTGLSAHSAMGQPPQKNEVFFSQGQAMYYPSDTSRSQLEATQDLISSGVLQAVAGLLGPASTQSMFAVIQEKILSNKEKYVDGYQLASEGLANGLYRVTGQVTVSKDLLVQDLREYGFPLIASTQSSPVPEYLPEKPARASLNPSPEADPGKSGRKAELTKIEVLWAVAENWEAKWTLPSETSPGETPPLARSIRQSTRSQEWTPRFAPIGSLQLDKQGNTDRDEVMAVSREIGLEKAVTGKSWLDGSQPGNQRLLASLLIFEVRTGRLEGEVHKERVLEGGSVQEGILHLSESLLPSVHEGLSQNAPPPEVTPRSDTDEHLGAWTVTIRAKHPQSAWENVRKEVESHFRSAQTSGFELGANEIKILIEGVDGRSLRDVLDTKQLSPGGQTIRIEDFSEEQRSMVVVFGNSGMTE